MWRAVLFGMPLPRSAGEITAPRAALAARSALGPAAVDVFHAFVSAAGFAEAATDSIGAFKRAWRELTSVRNRQGALLKVTVALAAAGGGGLCA